MGALLDQLMPVFDAARAEQAEIEGPADLVYATARGVDLLTVHSPLTDAAMWVRGLPDLLRRRSSEPLASVTIGDLFDAPAEPASTGAVTDPLGAWVPLAEQAPDELVFGVVGKVWKPSIEWRSVGASDFADFAEPGWAKIAVSVDVRARSATRSTLTYTARTTTTSPDAATRFAWYWRLVGPFAGVVMKAFVRTVRDQVEGVDDRPSRDRQH